MKQPPKEIFDLHKSLLTRNEVGIRTSLEAAGWRVTESENCNVYISPCGEWAIKQETFPSHSYQFFAETLVNQRGQIERHAPNLPRIFAAGVGRGLVSSERNQEVRRERGESLLPGIILTEALQPATEEQIDYFKGINHRLIEAMELFFEKYGVGTLDPELEANFEQRMLALCGNDRKLLNAVLAIGMTCLTTQRSLATFGESDIMQRADGTPVLIDPVERARDRRIGIGDREDFDI